MTERSCRPSRPSVQALLLLSLATGFVAAAAAQETARVLPYDGKCRAAYEEDDLSFELSAAPMDAAQVLEDRLPRLAPSRQRVVIELVDAVPLGGERIEPVAGLSIRPFRIDRGVDEVRVGLFAEPFLSESTDRTDAAAWALTHALLAARLGDAYDRMPAWMRDGVALWLNDPPEPLLLPTYGFQLTDEEIAPPLDAAWSPWHRYRDRLAMHLLERSAGPASVAKLVARLEAGTPPDEALAGVSGRTAEEFRDDVAEFVAEQLVRRETEQTAPLIRAHRADRAGEYMEVLALSRQVVEQPPISLHPEALMLAGRALNHLDNYEESAKPLRQMFALAPSETDFRLTLLGHEQVSIGHVLGDATFELARSQRGRGDYNDAAESYQRVLRDFPEAWLLEDALFELAHCENQLGRPEEAKRLLDVWLESFPDSEKYEQVKRLRGGG